MKSVILATFAASLLTMNSTAQNTIASLYPAGLNENVPAIKHLLENQGDAPADPAPLKTVTLSTGVTLQYAEQGDPNGVLVILLHGFPDSWYSYEPVLPHLPQSLHVYTITQRGFGNSDKPATGYSISNYTADVAAFIKAFNLPPVIVAGHSFGAYVTMQFAIEYPQHVRGIVLEGTIASFSDKKDMVDYNEAVVSQLQDPIDTAIILEFQRSTLVNQVPEAFFNGLINESKKAPAHVWRGVWEGLLTLDLRKNLKMVKKPTLIIWGDKDVWAPRSDQQLVADAIKGSKLVVYENTGHSVHWEFPEKFSKDVTKFIAGITKESSAKK
jgi:Predicted hydrolases or acyltransferases (alpha/beta hydrolase superfamily)